MRRYARAVLVAATTMLACSQPAPDASADSATKSADDEAAVNQVVQQEVAAVQANDANAFMQVLAADASVKPPNEPLANGTAALRAWLDNMLANVTINTISYNNESVTVSGDLAVHYYGFDWTVTPKGGQAMQEKGHGVHLLRRQADGSWKIIYDTWSADAAPPAAH